MAVVLLPQVRARAHQAAEVLLHPAEAHPEVLPKHLQDAVLQENLPAALQGAVALAVHLQEEVHHPVVLLQEEVHPPAGIQQADNCMNSAQAKPVGSIGLTGFLCEILNSESETLLVLFTKCCSNGMPRY